MMTTILIASDGHTELYPSQIDVRSVTGLEVREQVPGAFGNGYTILNMYYPVNLKYRATAARAFN